MTDTPAPTTPPKPDDAQRRCWVILGPEPISQCVFFNGHEGQHWFGTTEGRWVPEGEACCNLAAQVSRVHSQGGKIHLGLGDRCEDNARSTPAEALDVERLAQAIAEHSGNEDKPGWHNCWSGCAPLIAEVYARLRSPESDR